MAKADCNNGTARGSLAAAIADVKQELRIKVAPDSYSPTYFEGTRSQLEAEGLVPLDFEWPVRGRKSSWQADGFDFYLGRHRPAGMKGPMRLWLEGDNWLLSRRPMRHGFGQCSVMQANRLDGESYRQSSASHIQPSAVRKAHCRAADDEAFQHFKTLLRI
ncbi:hypothetical protein ACN9M1_17200 [Ralstonia sp. R-29]|uniref:hypothetical protein n=1 Tax=Ralstonia sp. R-29 TaxID=3404059 RepID=UPI003CF914A8